MLKSPLSALPCNWHSLTVLTLALALGACASPKKVDETASWSPNKLYAEAKDELEHGSREKAIQYFEKLEGRAAGTPLAQQAELDKAYAHYKQSEQAQAVATLDRFIKLHPTSLAMDYALYLKGVVLFNDNLGLFSSLSQQDLSERDQKSAKESFEAFKQLVERFPDSKYTPDARLRLTYIVNSLAKSEVHVARYYYKRGAYVAAINRAQSAVADYQGVPAAEEALYIIMLSYQALEMPELAKDAQRVLEKNFPQSVYLSEGLQTQNKPWWRFW